MPRLKWRTVEDLRSHLDPIVEELGRMPNQAELTALERHDLTNAIRKFRGHGKVAAALGYRWEGRLSWETVEDLRPHLEPIVAELGRMPNLLELRDRGRSDLVHAMEKHGRRRGVAAALGFPDEGYKSWDTIEDLRQHLDPIVAELGRMPNYAELRRLRRYDLDTGVKKFDGPRKVASLLGYPFEGRRSWPSPDALRADLDPVVAELGRMPTLVELGERGLDILVYPISKKFGGPEAVAVALGYGYEGSLKWERVEDLRPHLDPIADELGRMPSQPDLVRRGRQDLNGAIDKFGGFPKVAEALGYPYAFAQGAESRRRLLCLQPALEELHRCQRLLPGQVILLLRLAGLLSWGNFRETWQRLEAATGSADPVLDEQLSRLAGADPDASFFEDCSGTVALENPDPVVDQDLCSRPTVPPYDGHEAVGVVLEPECEKPPPGRLREAERAELRGWSALGTLNVVDVSESLVRLCVSRLKTAFYGFANQQRLSLEVPAAPPSSAEVEALAARLREAAFGEYGDLVANDLVRAACDAYVADLVGALLLPRREVPGYAPRLYQLDGARFVAGRVASSDRPFGLLFDQPGMGKTLTALWGLAAGGARRILVVAPLTVKREVWTPEAVRRAFPDLPDDRFAPGLDAAIALPADGSAFAVLHYEELRRHEDIRRLASPGPDGAPPFDALVFDEAHEVKERLSGAGANRATRTGARLLRAGARACVGLTATPVVNELSEPVSLLDLARGGSRDGAARQLRTRRLRDRVDVMEHLLADSLRRLKADVLFEIPPREERVHRLAPDAGQLGTIRAFLAKGRRHATSNLPGYRRLVLEAKLDWVAGFVAANLAATTPDGQPDPKTLVLCYNVDGIADRVRERLVAEIGPERVAYVSGATPPEEREASLRRFRAPATAADGVAVLVGTVGTVGVGVTLFDPAQPVTPHRVVFADLPYTWAEFEQGVDRLHRVGQRFPVTVDVPLVAFGDQLVMADGQPLPSIDEWVWDALLALKRRLADQVLDAAFDVTGYSDRAVRSAIRKVLEAADEAGGVVVLPPPAADSPAAEHRREVGRLRGMPRQRAAQRFLEPEASASFLAANDASPSARLAQRLVRERLGRWLDRRSVVVDLGCGSNPLRDLPCERVVGTDRHGANGGLVGDSAATGLPAGEADFVVMSLSMWGTPGDRLAYLREAERLLRPIGRLVVVEPASAFGGDGWEAGVARFGAVSGRLGMRLAEARKYTVDEGTRLVAVVVDNSSDPSADGVAPEECVWDGWR